MTAPQLTTDRLVLRGPGAQDFELYARFFDAQTGDGYFYGGPLKPYEAAVKLAADIGHWQMKGFGKFTIIRRTDDVPLGGCGIAFWDGWPSHELTWWLLKEHQRHGFATEAARAVLNWAYTTLGWDTVETHIRDTNEAAARLVTRLGGSMLRRDTFPDGIDRNVYGFACSEVSA